jgi:hypothetical protein
VVTGSHIPASTGMVSGMGGLLREQLSDEQVLLLREVFTPFDRLGQWPVWQYIDSRLDLHGVVAAEVLGSLPVAGGAGVMRMRYGLTWHSDSVPVPNEGTPIALTAAGLWHVRPTSDVLLDAFGETVRFLIEHQRMVKPSPVRIVQATAGSAEVASHLAGAGIRGVPGPLAEIVMRKVGQILEHEPYIWHGFARPDADSQTWSLSIAPVLREFRGVTTAEEYIDRMAEMLEPPAPPPVPPSAGPLDIPNAVGYLDAVWKSKTGSRLFVNLDPHSVARLTLACEDEGDFNSLMSALADVLAQVVTPGVTVPPQREALEKLRDYLVPKLDADPADRVSGAIRTLIRLRHIRVAGQHSDARHKAVAAFREIGLQFPPVTWDQAWAHVAGMARGALDVLREEVHAGLPET